jgi:hypothetical protein
MSVTPPMRPAKLRIAERPPHPRSLRSLDLSPHAGRGELLRSGRAKVLQIDKLFWRRQRRLDCAALAHESDDLGKAAEIDLGLSRPHAAIGIEVKRKRSAGDVVRCAGERDNGLGCVVAMGRIAYETECIGERADKADQRRRMGLGKIAPRRNHLELE